MRRDATVGAVGNVDASPVRLFKVAGHVIADANRFLGLDRRQHVGLNREVCHRVAGEQRRYEVGAGFEKKRNGAVSGVRAMLDTCDAGLERGNDAVFVVRVRCDFAAHARSCEYDFTQLVGFHLLARARGAVGHDAACRRDLDQVAAELDGITCCAPAIVWAVANLLGCPQFQQFGFDPADVRMAAGNAHAAGSNDPGSVNPAIVDSIAHRVHLLSGVPDVAHCREPRLERAHRIHDALHLQELPRHLEGFLDPVRPELALQVDVHVHQAGHDELVAQVDHGDIATEFGRISKAALYVDDSIALNNNRLVPVRRLAGHGKKYAGVNQRRLGCRDLRRE